MSTVQAVVRCSVESVSFIFLYSVLLWDCFHSMDEYKTPLGFFKYLPNLCLATVVSVFVGQNLNYLTLSN